MQFKKLNNIIGWIVFAIATFTYVSTIEPTASFWDCGEYIACAYKLEVGHPPGAPFFLLVGRFFALLAGGDPAMAGMMINIMSALCSSFTILFLFWSITRIGIKAIVKNGEEFTVGKQWAVISAGAVGALAYTFSDSFWFSAVEGEVYAMSSFFTALVFWAILKWDEEDTTDPVSAMRWLVVIAYFMGLSIGVHLLNLLAIPAICFIYYFKKHKFTWKSFFITGFISLIILGGIQNIMIPKIVKFAADYEIFFVNKLGMGFNIGSAFYFIVLFAALTGLILYTVKKKESYYKFGFYTAILFSAIAVISANGGGTAMFTRILVLGGLLYGIHHLKSKNINTLNIILVSFTTLIIGYSSFFVLIIRSQANTPMDENDPENAITMLSYLNREQYGDWPLTYGQYYNAPTDNANFKDGEPVFAKDEATQKYKIVDSRKKSIPAYEKEYCTPFPRMWSQQPNHEAAYRYWGDVQSHHKTKQTMNEQTGQMEEVQIPTFWANMTYFINYQVKYMYLRYFAWNFIGRQNDIQGLNGNPLEGNWQTGIKGLDDAFLDSDTSLKPHAASNNMASNSFYALPFILGLLGFVFHVKNNKNDAWVVSLLFLLNGVAVVFYLNQYPYQPRERDYAYVASFYAFAIFIGLGVLYIVDFLAKKTNEKTAAIVATCFGLVIPTLMAAEGWDDHDRSKRSMSRDFAVNYLNTCAPNAILFTNGDNDTFPLWYAQEVEGVRTDVRVVNLSLLQTDWYINQMRRAAYESAPVPFTIPEDKYVQSKREVVYIMDKGKGPMNLSKAIDFVVSDDLENKLDYGNRPLDYFPSKSFYVPVDSATVMKEKVIAVKDTARLVKSIKWSINRQYLTKNDLMVLDLIAHNNWKRPIYFAVTTGAEAYLGLEDYFQLEGLAYRLMPIKNTENEMSQGGRVNTDIMYDNIVNKFVWGGLDKPGVSLDENCIRMASNMRMQMATLAGALINKGQKQKAEKVLDLCLAKMPDENVRYEATLYTIIAGYYQIGNMKKATELSSKLFDIYENDFKVYKAQTSIHRAAFNREVGQAKEIMRRLVMLAEQFKQEAHSKELMKKITSIIPMDELMPEGQQQEQAQPEQQGAM
jgi:tetratricopeptide (TPR) repeat protein